MIDVHAHLEDDAFDDYKKIIENANKNGIETIICVGTDKATNAKVFDIAKQNSNVFCAVGLYPEYATSYDEEIERQILSLGKDKKVVAIGEIGLDYHNGKQHTEKQIQVFRRQIEIANLLDLPIQIHCREAMGDTLKVLRANKHLLKGGIMHCFNGSEEVANELISLGFKLSVGGVLTFKNSTNLQSVVKAVDINNIVLETDCPYLAPVPMRGMVNEPANIRFVCDFLAKLKGMSYDEVANITTKNAKEVFRIE